FNFTLSLIRGGIGDRTVAPRSHFHKKWGLSRAAKGIRAKFVTACPIRMKRPAQPSSTIPPSPCSCRLRRLSGPATRQPSDVNASEGQSEAEPGDGVPQVIVGQVNLQPARLRPAAGGRRPFLINIERSGRCPVFGYGDRIGITQVPDIFLRIIRRRE